MLHILIALLGLNFYSLKGTFRVVETPATVPRSSRVLGRDAYDDHRN
jgi:hypothetical protein